MQKENTPPVLSLESPEGLEDQLQRSPGRQLKSQLAEEAARYLTRRDPASSPSSSSSQSKAFQAAARRRAAAEWVQNITGIALPTASDHAMRAALRDGVIFCTILNTLRPGVLPKVIDSRNVTHALMTGLE